MALFKLVWRLLSGISKVISILIPLTIFGVFLFVISQGLNESSSDPLPEKAALLIAPTGPLLEDLAPIEPIFTVLNHDFDRPTLLSDVVKGIQQAAEDERIDSLLLKLDQLVGPSITQTLEIIDAVKIFKASGKTVIATGDFYSQAHYLLAAQADHVLLHPEGGIFLQGFAVYRSYIRSFLEKIRVKMHVFRVGTNKSAVEPYLRDSMSDAEKAVVGRWLGNLWSKYTELVETGRALPAGAIDKLISEFPERLKAFRGDVPELLLQEGLVDELVDHQRMKGRLTELIGLTDHRGEIQTVDVNRYLEATVVDEESTLAEQPLIAVIPVEGTLVPGESTQGMAGSDTIISYLDRASKLDDLAAVVLRVNSPGGSVFASDLIRRRLNVLRRDGIPIVVSMGSIAASGGYWISAEADEIWALPTTLTGSIGVFSAFPTIENFLNDIGVTVDGIGTTAIAGSDRVDMELNPQIAAIFQSVTDGVYQDFLDLVSSGRGLKKDRVEELAEGIVWTGDEAAKFKLVDRIGGLDQAVAAAGRLAEIDNFRVRRIGRAPSLESVLLAELGRSLGLALLPEGIWMNTMTQGVKSAVLTLNSLRDPKNQYVHCLTCVSGL